MPEKWEAVVYLLPGRPDDRTEIVQEFDTPDEALRWASGAVVSAYAESPDDHTRATFYPAHRMSHSVVRRKDG